MTLAPTNNEQNESEPPKKRYSSIDIFKGFTIMSMIFVNATQLYDNAPFWAKHAVEYGLNYADLVAPFFVFAMALNFKISYFRRLEREGRFKTYLRYLRRFLVLIVVGLVLTIYIDESGFYLRWGTLQVLGASGLLLLPLIEFHPIVRLIVAIVLLIIHQYLLATPVGTVITDSIEGGVIGTLSWGAMMILSSVLVERLFSDSKKYLFLPIIGGLCCLIIGLILNPIWIISRNQVSMSYTIITVGFSALIFSAFYMIFEQSTKKETLSKNFKFLTILGENSFLIFIVHLAVVMLIYLIVPLTIPMFLVIIIGISNIVGNWLFAYLLSKAEVYIVI